METEDEEKDDENNEFNEENIEEVWWRKVCFASLIALIAFFTILWIYQL